MSIRTGYCRSCDAYMPEKRGCCVRCGCPLAPRVTKNGSGVEYHQRETPITMPKTKSDETDSRPAAAVASAGTTPGDLAHEIDLLGAALRLTPEQRAAARLSAAVVSSRPADDR